MIRMKYQSKTNSPEGGSLTGQAHKMTSQFTLKTEPNVQEKYCQNTTQPINMSRIMAELKGTVGINRPGKIKIRIS